MPPDGLVRLGGGTEGSRTWQHTQLLRRARSYRYYGQVSRGKESGNDFN